QFRQPAVVGADGRHIHQAEPRRGGDGRRNGRVATTVVCCSQRKPRTSCATYASAPPGLGLSNR
ncbi:MAG: hypothetical protein M3N57_07785, partial [Actinomycetota bacterium]|nr:hypothetical protein [Actinomycetota bacterium]